MSITPAAKANRGTSEFNTAVHALRAFATIMVFCAHMLDSFQTYFFPDCEPLNLAMPFIKRFGTFGVELFFVISGYVIMSSVSRYDAREFFLRRFMRIYPMFAFFTILFFALNWFAHMFPEKLSFAWLLANLGFLDIYFGTQALSPNAWSLTYEANFYAIAGIGCFFLRERMRIALALLAIASLAFLVAFPISWYFAAGCVIYFTRHLQPRAMSPALQIAIALVWCFLAATVVREGGPPGWQSVAMNVLLLAWTTLFFFVTTAPQGELARLAMVRWIFFMGTISYSFYLTHPYSYFAIRVLLQKVGFANLNIGVAAAIYFPLMTGAAVAASYLVYRFLEIGPYRAMVGEAVFKARSSVSGGSGETRRVRPDSAPVAQT
jgi:peptidoglycan/LPS O-acetylase OafA/YrhL